MQRIAMLTIVTGAAGLALFFAVRPAFLEAQSSGGPAGSSRAAESVAAKSNTAQLPIARVVLFSSGVGYFQREGEVDGHGRVDLTFPVQDINDLLKSLVLQDLGGGQITAVSYDSQDPIDKTLKSFALDLTSNPTFGQLLNQARGEKVEVVMQAVATQPSTLSGMIVGMEKQRQPVGKDGAVDMDMLNLLTADGLRSCPLSQVQRVRFLNPVIDSELKRALETLAMSHDTRKKAVSLNFSGQGKRPVRVGYVVENPIWKTSYRLVVNKEGKPFLQGWAIVENTGDEDWNNVQMALVSGRPISFRMDLYQSLYLPRPLVEPELFASLRPPTYTGAVEKAAAAKPGAPAPEPQMRRALDAGRPMGGAGEGKGGGFGYAGEDRKKSLADDKAIDIRQGVASAASATDMGDFFQYAIDQPVTLARQKSAMLPIVQQEVEGTKVSIYNQAVHAKFPLLGLKFKNTTGLHLMQGPITVFEGASYSGDARILDLQPKEERLLSYAIDLGMEVEPVTKGHPDQLIAVKIVKGLLHATHKQRLIMTYNVKNRSENDRTLLIEHPFRADWKLITPEKPAERSRDVYRFELKLPSGKSASQEVVEEQDRLNQYQLTSLDDQTIRFFVSSNVVSTKVKEALGKAIEMKTALATVQRELADTDRQLKTISDEQARLRANIKELPPTSAAYKRYLEKFDTQETEIEKLQAESKKLRDNAEQKRREFETYVLSLSIE
jgi:hypothetical protein